MEPFCHHVFICMTRLQSGLRNVWLSHKILALLRDQLGQSRLQNGWQKSHGLHRAVTLDTASFFRS